MSLKGGATMKKIMTIFTLVAMLIMAVPMTASAYVEGGIPPDVTTPEEPKDHGNDGMYFKETGFNVAGDFWYYWRDHGLDLGHEGVSFSESLALFGYPITRAFEEKFEDGSARWVQYFERARFEIHEENKGTEFYVLLGHFGRDIMAKYEWPSDVTDPASPKGGDCMFFEETAHNLCGDFMFYWLKNGGLMVFGYPIGEPTNQTFDNKTLWVQYFERGRMELHEDNKGTPYFVLLGHFGREVLEMRMGKGEGHKPAPPAQTPDHKPAPPTSALPPSGESSCVVVHEYQLRDLTEISADIEFLHVQFWWEGVPERETLFPPGRYTIPTEWSEGKLRGMVWELGGSNCTADAALRDHLNPSMDRRVAGGVNHAGYLHWTWLVEQEIVSVAWQPNPVPTVPNILP